MFFYLFIYLIMYFWFIFFPFDSVVYYYNELYSLMFLSVMVMVMIIIKVTCLLHSLPVDIFLKI